MLTGGDKAVLKMLKEKLMSRFATTDMGDISFILGMQVIRNRENGTLTISQANYSRSVLEKYGMRECKPVNTPGAGKQLSLDQPEGNRLNDTEMQRYQAITGLLIYLAQVTRYDIFFSGNCTGDVKAVQRTHGGSQARSSLPCRHNQLRHHLQERGFYPNRVFGC